MPVKIPYNYARLLSDEYGKSALTKTEHSGYAPDTILDHLVHFADDNEVTSSIPPARNGQESGNIQKRERTGYGQLTLSLGRKPAPLGISWKQMEVDEADAQRLH